MNRHGATVPGEVNAFLQRLPGLARRVIGGDIGLLFAHNENDFRLIAADGATPDGLKLPHEFLCERIRSEASLPIFLNDPRDAFLSALAARSAAVAPIYAAAGEIAGWLCVADVSERAWSEQECADLLGLAAGAVLGIDDDADRTQSEEEKVNVTVFRRLFHDNPLPMWIYDIETLRFLDVNEVAERLYGYSRDEFLSMRIADIRPPEDVPRLMAQVAKPLTTFTDAGEWRHLRKDGGLINVRITSHLMEFEGHTAKLVVVQDVSDRVRAEESLAESHKALRALVDASPIAVLALDVEGRVTLWSPAAERIFGWKEEEVLGRPYPLVPEGMEQEFRENLARVIQGDVITDMEIRRRRKDGSLVYVSLSTSRITDAHGQTVGCMAMLLDNTARRAAEARLKESQERYKSLFTNNIAAIGFFDLKGRLLSCNKAVEDITGYTEQELLGRQFFDRSVPDDQKQALQRFFLKVQRTPQETEWTIRHRSGRTIAIQIIGNPAIVEGRVVGVHVVGLDITERKQAEAERAQLIQEIHRERQRLQDLVANLPGVVWEAWGKPDDAEQRIDYVSPGVVDLLGYSVEEWLSTPNFWLRLVHPDDREEAGRYAADAYASCQGGINEFRWVARDGRVLWVEAHSVVVCDEDGRPAGMRGVTLDVTSRKTAEAELQESERRFRDLLQHVQLASVLLDDGGHITFCNNYLLRLTGYAREEVMGRGWFDMFVPENMRDEIGPDFMDSLRLGALKPHDEYEILCRSGERRLISWDNTVLRNSRGAIIGSASIGSDITETRAAERALRTSEAKNRAIVDALPDLLFRLRGDGTYLEVLSSDETMLIAPAEELSGKTLVSVLPPEPAGQILELIEKALRTGEVHDCVYSLPLHGEERYFEARVVASGEDEVLLIARDITDRRRDEEILHRREQEFRALAENSPDVIARLDRDLRHVYINPAIEGITGVRPADHIGKTWQELGMPPALVDLWIETARLVFDEGEERDIEYEIPTTFGRGFCQSRFVPELRPDGTVVTVLAITRDITELKKADEVIKGQNSVLEMITKDAPLQESLGALARFVEEQAPAAYCSISLLDPASQRLVLRVAPSLPEEIQDSIREIPVGRIHAVDGNPLSSKARVLMDIAREPLWEGYGHALLAKGFQTCWAEPIMSSGGTALGALLVFYREDRRPARDDLESIDAAAYVAGIAIQREQSEIERDALIRQLEAERALLEAVLRQMPAGVVIAEAPSGRVYLGNEQVERILGHPPEHLKDVARYRDKTLRHPDGTDYKPDDLPLARAIRKGETISSEEALIPRSDGRLDIISVDAAPVRDREGRIVAGVATFQDITARRRSEQSALLLAESTRLMASSLEYEDTLVEVARRTVPFLADACIVTLYRDERPRTIAVVHDDASRAARLKQVHEAYLAAAEAGPEMPDVRREGLPSMLAEVTLENMIADRVPEEVASRFVEAGVTSLMAVPLRARGRTQGSLVFYNVDSGRRFGPEDLELVAELGHRAALAVDNARLYHEIVRADRMKDEFLAMLGHELRNPLGAISNAMQLMRLRGIKDEPLVRIMGILDRQTRHMARLVDDLLDVSRITRGKIALRPEPVNLAAIVDQAVQTTRPLIETRSHALTVNLPEEPVFLEADPERLSQVFANLLNNAAKYTEPGGHITVAARREGGQVAVSVRDSGIGISEDLLPRVFELFTQAERSLDRSLGGLGVGLTVVRNLVEMHGGSVQVFSGGPGQGSEFVVRLPALAPAAEEPENPSEQEIPPAPEGRRVLVVDDNVDTAEALISILELWGYEVRMAHDGETALEVARTFDPDVVLLDIGLPGMDGYEVARRLKGVDAFRGVLIAITGYGQDEDRERSKRSGFDQYLVKPVDLQSLARLLREVLS